MKRIIIANVLIIISLFINSCSKAELKANDSDVQQLVKELSADYYKNGVLALIKLKGEKVDSMEEATKASDPEIVKVAEEMLKTFNPNNFKLEEISETSSNEARTKIFCECFISMEYEDKSFDKRRLRYNVEYNDDGDLYVEIQTDDLPNLQQFNKNK